jgi:hypothetical protein
MHAGRPLERPRLPCMAPSLSMAQRFQMTSPLSNVFLFTFYTFMRRLLTTRFVKPSYFPAPDNVA